LPPREFRGSWPFGILTDQTEDHLLHSCATDSVLAIETAKAGADGAVGGTQPPAVGELNEEMPPDRQRRITG
jgi:hypothetical protein